MLREPHPPPPGFWTGFLFEVMHKVLGESKHQAWLERSCGVAAFQGLDSIRPVLHPAKQDICSGRHSFANVCDVIVLTLGKHNQRGGLCRARPELTASIFHLCGESISVEF